MEDLRKLSRQISAFFLEPVIAENMVELFIDPTLISSMIKVNTTSHICEALRFVLFSIINYCRFFRRGIRLLNILDIFVIESLAGFKVDKTIP